MASMEIGMIFPGKLTLHCIIIILLSILRKTECISCYHCQGMAHPRDCDTIVNCGTNEVCSVGKYVTADGHVYFSSRCEAAQVCGLISRKRRQNRDIELCLSCCRDDYCNKELCDQRLPSVTSMVRCLKCDSIDRPENCQHVIGCHDDEVCFTQQQISGFDEIRYSLGCTKRMECQSHLQMSNIVGRDTSFQFCAECCDTENCNRDLCKTDNSSVTLSPGQSHVTETSVKTQGTTESLTQAVTSFTPGLPAATAPSVTKTSVDISGVTPACYDVAGDRCQDFTLLRTLCKDLAKAYTCAKACKLCIA